MQFRTFDLGLVEFKRAWDFQKEIFSRIKYNEFNAAIIFCRHYPVITLGRSADNNSILADRDELQARGMSIYEIERGGSITYHGPGQLIIYPVFNLIHFKKDINLFLRSLERVIITVMDRFAIAANRRDGLTGVWVKDKKIASIGIAIRNWITYHGLAINVKKDDLENFLLIRPCGADIIMTSMESVLNRRLLIESVKDCAYKLFEDIVNRECLN